MIFLGPLLTALLFLVGGYVTWHRKDGANARSVATLFAALAVMLTAVLSASVSLSNFAFQASRICPR